MNPKFKKFIIRVSLFTLIVFLLTFIVIFTINQSWFLPIFPVVTLFFYIITVIIHYILSKSAEKRMAKFSVNFMLSTSLKLIIFLMFMVLYVVFDKQNAVSVILLLFINYLLFTVFEVVSILKELRNPEKIN